LQNDSTPLLLLKGNASADPHELGNLDPEAIKKIKQLEKEGRHLLDIY